MIRTVIDHDVVDMFFQNSTAFDFHKDREAFIKHMNNALENWKPKAKYILEVV